MGAMIDKTEFDLVQFITRRSVLLDDLSISVKGSSTMSCWKPSLDRPAPMPRSTLDYQPTKKPANCLHYLTDLEVEKLVQGHANKPNFGGRMLWDVNSAAKNTRYGGRPYYQAAKDALNKFAGGSAPIREAVQVTSSKDIPVVTSSTKVRTVPPYFLCLFHKF